MCAKQELGRSSFEPNYFFNAVNIMSHSYCRAIGADPEILLATLLLVVPVGDYIKAYMYGDGAIASEDMAGKITVIEREFDSNAPCYLCYDYNKHMKQDYLDHFGIRTRQFTYEITGEECTMVDDKSIALDSSKPYLEITFPINECSMVAVMSDGVSSFIDMSEGRSKEVESKMIFSDLLKFKNSKGVFVKRRMKKAMKEWAAKGYVHTDDLSLGALMTGSMTT
jgi:hypothetical protein